MDYSDVNDSARELYAALARDLQDKNGTLNTAGTAPNYTLSLNRSSISALGANQDGLVVGFQCHASNSGAATTLNVNATGARSLVLSDGNDPNIYLDGIYIAVYDHSNTRWILVSATLPQNQILGFSTVVASRDFTTADQNQYVTISAGGVTLNIPGTGIGGSGATVRIGNITGFSFNISNTGGGTLYESFSATTTTTGSTRSSLSGRYYTLRQLTSNNYLLSDW